MTQRNGHALSECYTLTHKPGVFAQGTRRVGLARVIKGLVDLLVMVYWRDLRLERDEELLVVFTPVVDKWDFCIRADWVIEGAKR